MKCRFIIEHPRSGKEVNKPGWTVSIGEMQARKFAVLTSIIFQKKVSFWSLSEAGGLAGT